MGQHSLQRISIEQAATGCGAAVVHDEEGVRPM